MSEPESPYDWEYPRFELNSFPAVAPSEGAWVECVQPLTEEGKKVAFRLDHQQVHVGIGCSHVNLRLGADGMSRRHALFELKGGRWWISDGSSTHGTQKNGERVYREPVALSEGDRIELGPNHVYVFHAPSR